MKLLASLFFFINGAHAVTIPSGDYAGADITVANGDELNGTYTNVGHFAIPTNATATVKNGVQLAIYASTVSINGVLNGAGRGEPGGDGGVPASAGINGQGTGGGGGGTYNVTFSSGQGGGGGGHASAGGTGSGPTGGAGGGSYGAAAAATAPISADDALMGSGGGGGGANLAKPGGNGGAGGAAVYIEASSMTVRGMITVNGSTASATTDGAGGDHPAAGGGGAGGTIVLRIKGGLELVAARFTASGGAGGDVALAVGGTIQPGGGGSAGRVKIYSQFQSATYAATISTAPGNAGGNGATSGAPEAPVPTAGGAGTVSFGTVASPPSALTPFDVGQTSITWSWTATPSFGDGAGTGYRLYPATVTAPFPGAEQTAAGGATQLIVTGLQPNTTYNRMLTARTDWGDSLPSMAVSTWTHAAAPAANGFSATAENSVTFAWTAPTNPAYTSYTVERALDGAFTTPATGSVVTLSSAPAGLLPNTTYFFRARAVNLSGIPTAFTAAASTSTLAAVPASAVTGGVVITSASFNWAANVNPAGTLYQAQISTNGFQTINASSFTVMTTSTFTALAPGVEYFFRVRALNNNSVPSNFTAAISTRPGNLGVTPPPSAPGTPVADRQFSYDGAVVFNWDLASSALGILDYDFFLGSTPGGSDILAVSTTSTSYPVTGLATGRTYYAFVRATSNGGVDGPFSPISAGLPVFISNQSPSIPKPINWPNPFDPAQGPTQIGFFMTGPGSVTLTIYTLTGSKVYSETRQFAAGNQIFPWNGNSSSGGRVAPGGYVCLIETSNGQRQKFKIAVVY